jgi:hypothetical protein
MHRVDQPMFLMLPRFGAARWSSVLNACIPPAVDLARRLHASLEFVLASEDAYCRIAIASERERDTVLERYRPERLCTSLCTSYGATASG